MLTDAFRLTAALADRMATRIEDGEREEAVTRYGEQGLHPDGIDELESWPAVWPVWHDCVELAEEVVRMNRAVLQSRLPDALAMTAPVLVLTGTDGPRFIRESARGVQDVLPHSRLVEFDSLGHSGPGRPWKRIAAEVEAFRRE